ncbi:MAG: DNA polymerase III subunit [Prevotellaceae bacterium]|jgi:DNA polymerase-3 subunit delta'|nr:DNA polymerase III subunit [Prevotellaceae bacterium]
MLFKNIYGQENVKQIFIRAVQENRIPHALLITGPEGSGKLPLAIAFARYVCCENRSDTDACGVCSSCVKFDKLIHPDLHFVFPITRPKDSVTCDYHLGAWREQFLQQPYFSLDRWLAKIGSEDKNPVIYANESEEITRKLNIKSYEADYKIMIIWLPEKMHEVCANKLLKILEEPPEKTLFMLVTENAEQLLTTIVSRTQRIAVPPLDKETVCRAIAGRYQIEEPERSNIAHIANGNLIRAEEIIRTSSESREYFDLFAQVMRASYSRNAMEMKRWSETMSRLGRKRQTSFLQYTQRMIRENFILNLKNSDLNYMTGYENDFSARFSPFVNERNIFGLLSELESAERHIERNVQAKPVFFDLALKMIMLLKNS